MKGSKKAAIIMALIFALALPITAFAGTTNSPIGNSIRQFCGIDTSNLTTAQKTDMMNSWKNVMEAKKDSVKKMVENKTITKAEGDATLKSIDEMIKYRTENGFGTGLGNGNGYGMMNGYGNGNGDGNGMMNGYGNGYGNGNGNGMMNGYGYGNGNGMMNGYGNGNRNNNNDGNGMMNGFNYN